MNQIEQLMALADHYAHVYSFVGDDTMPNARQALRAAIEQAIKDEREANAKIAETLGVHPSLNVYNGGPDWHKHGKEIARAIRQRSET